MNSISVYLLLSLQELTRLIYKLIAHKFQWLNAYTGCCYFEYAETKIKKIMLKDRKSRRLVGIFKVAASDKFLLSDHQTFGLKVLNDLLSESARPVRDIPKLSDLIGFQEPWILDFFYGWILIAFLHLKIRPYYFLFIVILSLSWFPLF